MADNQRTAQLLIQARADGLKTFDSAIQQVQKLGKAVDEQSAAASRGEKSINDLAGSVKALEQVGRTVTSQAGLIDGFNTLSTALDTATKKAVDQRAAAVALERAYNELTAPTRAQTRELTNAQKAADAADKSVDRLTKRLETQADRLARAKIPTDDLEASQQKLITTAAEIGAALTRAGEAQDAYAANVQRAGEIEEARIAAAAAGYARFEAAARKASAAFSASEAEKRAKALADEEQRIRSAAVAEQLFEAAARKGSAAYAQQQSAAAELSAFQKIGTDAQAAAVSIGAVTTAAAANRGNLSQFAAEVLAIVDPSAKARDSLAGLEAEAQRLADDVGEAKKPIKDYQDAINDLGRVQKSVLSTATAVDAFRNEQTTLEALTATVERHRAELGRLGAAAASATEPDAELASAIKAEEAALVSASRAADVQRGKLQQLSQALEHAGVDSTNLEGETKRLAAVAGSASATLGKLQQAASGQGSRVGAFLGLKPYELQNLSYQVNDVVSGIASGQHLTQVIAQQGGQIFQLFQSQLTKFVAFLPEIAIAVVILGTIYAAIKRVFDTAQAVKDFQNTLSTSADASQYNAKALADMARGFEDAGGKAKDAASAIKTFVAAGVSQSAIPAFLANAKQLAKVMGTDVPTAAKTLADGFTGGYQAVAKLDDQLNFLTAAQREQIRADFDSGNATKARSEAIDALSGKLEDQAQKSRGPWKQAADNLKNAFILFLDTVGQSPPFKFLETLLEKSGDLAAKVTSFAAGSEGKNPLESGTRFTNVSDVDLRRVTQVVLSEAGGNLASQAGVTNVIANRAFRVGGGPDSLKSVLQPSQFEVLANGAADKIDTASKTFQDAMERVRTILTSNRNQDPTNGAVNFFAPGAQRALGRNTPGFANPQLQTFAAGGTSFFQGTFPGDRVAAQRTAATQAQTKAFQDLTRTYQQAQTEAEKTDDQQRLDVVRRIALEDAYNHKLTDQQAARVANLAVATEQFKIDQERLGQQKQLVSSLASALSAAAGATNDPEKRAEAVKLQYQSLLTTLDQLRKTGFKGLVNGMSLNDVSALITAQEKIAENAARQKAYEDQLATADAARVDALKTINDQYKAGQITAVQAIQQTQEVTSKYDAQLKGIVDKGVAFGNSLKDAATDPKIQAFLTKLRAAVQGSDAAGIAQSLSVAQDQISRLTDARSKALSGIVAQQQSGDLSPVAAVTALNSAQQQQNVGINSAVNSLLPTVKALAALKPSPEMTAFVTQLESLQKQTAAGTTLIPAGSEAGKDDLAIYNQAMTNLNSLIAARNELIDTYKNIEAQGGETTQQTEARSAAAFKAAAGPIQDQINAVSQLLVLLGKTGTLTAEQVQAAQAKLQLVAQQTTYVSATFTQLKNAATNAIAQGITQSVETAGQDLADLIDGTQKVGDVFVDLGRITASFFATFLKSIAEAIIQLEALQIAKSIIGAVTGGGGFFGLHHAGGISGFGSMFRSNVDPMIFAAAPRYHAGSVGVGLAANEQAAILKRGEEVLTEDNPRHIKNIIGGGGAPAKAEPARVTVLNAVDSADLLAKALGTPEGHQVVVNYFRGNGGQLKGALGVKG